MLQGYAMAIVPCGNPTPKKLPTGGGEWPTFRTAHGTPPIVPCLPTSLLLQCKPQAEACACTVTNHVSPMQKFSTQTVAEAFPSFALQLRMCN